MTGTPRKPLGLPPKVQSDEAIPATGRRPVRGGAPKRKTAAEVAQVNAAYAAKARAQQEKPRGTPSRAPVTAKAPLMVRKPPSTPVTASGTGNGTAPGGVRISKLMAERGLCSRRDADGYIERGWVFVDGKRMTELGTRADPSVVITLAREAQIQQTWQMTILLHKPVGYVSGQPEPGFTPAVTLIQPEAQFGTADTPLFHPRHLKGLAPAGRLDIDSTGLLVLTQDGRVARQLIGEDSQVDKEYLVRVEGRLDAAGLALLNHGLSLDDKKLKPAKVEWLNEDQLRFVLREGRKRQIRRMCELVGLHVVGLKRVRIGGIKLGDLPLGQWRFLREDERF
jgi:23S rRNA pseudouridine2604 synthase